MSDVPTIAREALDQFRDGRWHRTPSKKVTDDAGATQFLQDVPCCLAFGGYKVGVPTLWVAACGERDPEYPEHSHHNPAVGLVWQAKDTLVQAGVAYYGRLFLRKPSFVARAWLPTVLAAYPKPELSPQARAIVNALRERGPLPTAELGERTGLTERKRLTKALEEVQVALEVVKTEEQYDPFTFIWGTLDHLFGDDVAHAGKISAETAGRKLVHLWIGQCGAIGVRKLASALVWPVALVEQALAPLVESGAVLPVKIEGVSVSAVADAEAMKEMVPRGLTMPSPSGARTTPRAPKVLPNARPLTTGERLVRVSPRNVCADFVIMYIDRYRRMGHIDGNDFTHYHLGPEHPSDCPCTGHTAIRR